MRPVVPVPAVPPSPMLPEWLAASCCASGRLRGRQDRRPVPEELAPGLPSSGRPAPRRLRSGSVGPGLACGRGELPRQEGPGLPRRCGVLLP